ncbi:transcription initiation factor TFIID [Salix suchowensis]|nr:transcription initiation factor TFIID [Salix suchowensis]
MEEQLILRVPPSIAEKLDRLLSETASSSEEQSLDLSFSEDGRSGTFVIGDERFPASLLDFLMVMVREAGDTAPDVVEYRHGLTPPMRDARKRRFRREPDLNPELVQRVEKDLLNIMAGGTVDNADILHKSLTEVLHAEANEQEEGVQNAHKANKKPEPAPEAKPDVPETTANAGEPERSDSDDSDDSI